MILVPTFATYTSLPLSSSPTALLFLSFYMHKEKFPHAELPYPPPQLPTLHLSHHLPSTSGPPNLPFSLLLPTTQVTQKAATIATHSSTFVSEEKGFFLVIVGCLLTPFVDKGVIVISRTTRRRLFLT